MLARGPETLKSPYNPLIHIETNVEKLFARSIERLKSPCNNFRCHCRCLSIYLAVADVSACLKDW